jgi:hypothetical protein
MPTGWRGGDKLETYLKDMGTKVSNAKSVSVGFLENATEPSGVGVAMVAAIQEFGAPGVGIPSRPFFRNMIAAHKSEWGEDVTKILQAHDYDADHALNLMGEHIGGQLRQSIIDLVDPPLSPTTLMLREMRAKNPSLVVNKTVVREAAARVAAGKPYTSTGTGAKPLVDTGTMLQSVDYEVTD